jgi:predicted nuclease of restriction endonuclease-like (RecB) superfamily
MCRFYELYPLIENLPQLGAKSENENLPQLVTNFDDSKNIFLIPWGHHKVIIDKCRSNQQKALFYVSKVIENNWSRAVLLNLLDTDLYDRQGKAITNFQATLPAAQSDLAQAITKNPYNFDFLTLTEKYNEKELKDALMDNITRFLLELGNGFSFVGREYRLEIGETENFVDMLFFNINLKCYVVLEVKVTEFEPSFAGQLGTYVVAVNHQLKEDWQNPAVGLLVCKSMDKIEAQYALESTSQPLGVSSYELSKLIPENFKGSLPTIEEIEAELNDDI